ncbi:MAG: NAD(+)/NADH kinase [Chlamydiae bacterium]|nr:NAD(+)/NADH kinase [Chlamydiota bacterium]
MIIALFPNEEIPSSYEIASQIQKYLAKKKVTVVAEDAKAKKINAQPLSSVDLKKIKFLISMGGDGTILRLSYKYANLNAAILGINLGKLGFMADIPADDIFPSLDDLLNKAYKIENRIMIECTTPQNKTLIAANDIVLHRSKYPNLIELGVFVDNSYFNTFRADGLILSTPNGSTAYSLSAGGPLLAPNMEGFVLTPICPHTISNRPFVLSSNMQMQIQNLSSKSIEVISDGSNSYSLKPKEKIFLKKSSKTFTLVKLKRHDYFSTLRSKLNWSGKLS